MRRNATRDPKTGRFMAADDQRHLVGQDEFFEDVPQDIDKRKDDKNIMLAIIVGFIAAFLIFVLLFIFF